MDAIFFVLRVPAYVVGLVVCVIAVPVDSGFLAIEFVAGHAFTAVVRLFGAPFVVVWSAYFDRKLWPRYLEEWEKAHDGIDPDWDRPIRRFAELTRWLVHGPRQ